MMRDSISPVDFEAGIVIGRRDPDRKMAANVSDGIQMGADTQTQGLIPMLLTPFPIVPRATLARSCVLKLC